MKLLIRIFAVLLFLPSLPLAILLFGMYQTNSPEKLARLGATGIAEQNPQYGLFFLFVSISAYALIACWIWI